MNISRPLLEPLVLEDTEDSTIPTTVSCLKDNQQDGTSVPQTGITMFQLLSCFESL